MRVPLGIVGWAIVGVLFLGGSAMAANDPVADGAVSAEAAESEGDSVESSGAEAGSEPVAVDVDAYLTSAARQALLSEGLLLTPQGVDEYFARGARPATVSDDHLLTAVRVGLLTTQVFDLSTTTYGIGTGRVREANPMLAWAADHPIALAGLKLGGTAFLDWSVRRLAAKGHRRAAVAVGVALSAVSMTVAVHNMREIRSTGR